MARMRPSAPREYYIAPLLCCEAIRRLSAPDILPAATLPLRSRGLRPGLRGGGCCFCIQLLPVRVILLLCWLCDVEVWWGA